VSYIDYDLFIAGKGLRIFCLVRTPGTEEVPAHLSVRMAHQNVRRITREEHSAPTHYDRSINVAPQILPEPAFDRHRLALMFFIGPICTVAYDRAIWTLKPTFAQAPGVSPMPINE
jgi:hypothetical protein